MFLLLTDLISQDCDTGCLPRIVVFVLDILLYDLMLLFFILSCYEGILSCPLI